MLWATCPLDALSERVAIEDAVMMRLATLLRGNGGFLSHLSAYNGEIDEENADDFMREIRGQSPAILVSTSTGRYDEMSTSAQRATNVITVDLMVISATMSGHGRRTRGDLPTGTDVADPAGGDPGIYHMLAAIRRRLMGRRISVAGAGTLLPSTEQMLYTIQNLTAWRAVYRVPVRISQSREDADDFELANEILARHYNYDELEARSTLVAESIATPDE